MQAPLVSVCIPTFNRPEGLSRTLDCVCGQSYTHLEIIVSDNASTNPKVRQILNEYMRRDTRIRVFYQQINSGPSPNFEFARSKANGIYYMWCADDDYIDSNFIEKCVSILEKDKTLTLVSGSLGFVNGEPQYERQVPKGLSSKFLWIRIASYLLWVHHNYIFYGLYRRCDLGHFPILNQLGGDWSFVVRQLLCGRVVVTESCKIYCSKSQSVSSSLSSLQRTLGLAPWTAKLPRIAITMTLIRDTIGARRHLYGKNICRDLLFGLMLSLILLIRWPTEILHRKIWSLFK